MAGHDPDHDLKCWPDVFLAVWAGDKKAEFRKDDRGYREHDVLRIREWSPASGLYSGREIHARITHIAHGGNFGIPKGYAMLSIDVIERTDAP